VLEERVHVPAGVEHRADRVRPCPDVLVRVLLPPQAEVRERFGWDLVAVDLGAVRLCEAPGHAVLGEEVARLEPGLVAELHRVRRDRRQVADEALDQLAIEMEARRALEEDRSQVIAEQPGSLEELGNVAVCVA
jgi:hypothetical protein